MSRAAVSTITSGGSLQRRSAAEAPRGRWRPAGRCRAARRSGRWRTTASSAAAAVCAGPTTCEVRHPLDEAPRGPARRGSRRRRSSVRITARTWSSERRPRRSAPEPRGEDRAARGGVVDLDPPAAPLERARARARARRRAAGRPPAWCCSRARRPARARPAARPAPESRDADEQAPPSSAQDRRSPSGGRSGPWRAASSALSIRLPSTVSTARASISAAVEARVLDQLQLDAALGGTTDLASSSAAMRGSAMRSLERAAELRVGVGDLVTKPCASS